MVVAGRLSSAAAIAQATVGRADVRSGAGGRAAGPRRPPSPDEPGGSTFAGMNRPINVLELRSVRGTGGGPEKTILKGAARTDPSRFRVVVCYIRDRRDKVFAIDAKAAELGVHYVDVWERHSFDPSIWPDAARADS